MSLRVGVLLSISGLVACSQTTAVAVKALGAEQRDKAASEAATKPISLESALRPTSTPYVPAAGNSAGETIPNQPKNEATPSGKQARSDGDLDEMQRIRKASMADSLF